MNSPYYKRFKVSQKYKGIEHKGLDLVGIDSKEIHATCDGIVRIARWENANNHMQGFGKYVMIEEYGTDRCFIYGHLSEILVKVGDIVHITDVIGIEGSTGNSTGSHCHYEVRDGDINGESLNISEISGIPNIEWEVYDDGYRENEKDIESYVIDVINGLYGNGEVRRNRLGNMYDKVQNRVNEYYKISEDVIEGMYGNGEKRKEKLEQLGYNYELVQRLVNETLGY